MGVKIANRCTVAVLAMLAATAIWAGCSHRSAEVQPTQVTEAPLDPADAAIDPARWGKLYPLHYQQWKLTSEPTPAGLSKYKRGYDVGEQRRDKLDEYPFLALLYNGWGFGAEYNEPRGHYYMVQDQLEVDPGRIKAGGACLTCKTPYAPKLAKEMGAAYFPTPYKEVLARLPKANQTLGVACIDCHDNKGMTLKISRGFTLGKALKEIGEDETKLSRGQKRTFVCAQCHVTYIIPKDKEMHSTDVFFPWAGSKEGHITIENIIKQIKSSPANLEWTQAVTGFKLGFVRHPEYEFYSNQSPHYLEGVTCADCHMPMMSANGQELTDHRIMSPLKGSMSACAACHSETPQQLRQKVIAIQDRFIDRYLKTGYAVATDAKLFEMANKAKAAGKQIDNELYAMAREHYEQAFYRLIFVGAENSTGFHNPAEGMRVIEDAASHAAGADMHLRQLLAKAGVPAPEKVDLELTKYTNNRGAKKLQFRQEHEILPPTLVK
ncbi:ammonia-forming cytochrome c nitrite reductase subunit c552 [Geomonas sp. Red69]|uniref:Ammonia-forming cytochrome c nitrite reductase subunit c552 n=1 Tax=Geomonas diazotrophica TaxID=2843197 RepID=A0ABX8JQE5_9BACT|nr:MULTISPECIES: ammonia-forming cytochrome c nitrite reductase subunit c552 [Geomonas]MBU5637584.1 ammonia-forming cytochrome c nitrite reductase subunit c552 [Geomonas diazotrophica]QWV99296.1 ammonia-forming cytochrome c nitrite reductase subunit c552 [Geomonas nitrogeniifigens]QXE88463.1 ammonia-forming cytochrome c nitrite reductase subunit c552 [Geomonas nitrogeniifigens]